ncbi:hypothetical protein H6G96_13840 [Nostoc sp. FACHB-892]|uniref:hypothetical protein n=1 Tax=Nostoc sp. FACHB-892 TaxID=2692843 RepID=UPI001688A729|nr:hypothetical protein [Nostoc sp. FACHB-892]MBD2727382.1 hypothetical protein [Nostoc sp. FACHB-892]
MWRELSQVVGEEVCKKNIQSVLRRYQQSQSDGLRLRSWEVQNLAIAIIPTYLVIKDHYESYILISTPPIIDSVSVLPKFINKFY